MGKSPNSMRTTPRAAVRVSPVVDGVDPRHQTGGTGIGRSELPDPCGIRFGPEEPVIGLERVHTKGGSLAGLTERGHRHPLADVERLETRNECSRARPAEVVEEIVAVPAGPQAAHLDDPRPDRTGAAVDGDCPRGDELSSRKELVPGKIERYFSRRGSPAEMVAPVERGCQKRREVVENVSELDRDVMKVGHCAFVYSSARSSST